MLFRSGSLREGRDGGEVGQGGLAKAALPTCKTLEWEVGVRRCRLLYMEWINNKVLLYSTENCIQYPVKNHNGKEYEKECVCIYMCN